MPIPYRTLFLFESDTATIFEIKRLDVQSANPGDVYFWLYFDQASQTLYPLTFLSMSAEENNQQREFAQGHLRFTATEGTYTPATEGPMLPLRVVNPPVLPDSIETALFAFFRSASTAV